MPLMIHAPGEAGQAPTEAAQWQTTSVSFPPDRITSNQSSMVHEPDGAADDGHAVTQEAQWQPRSILFPSEWMSLSRYTRPGLFIDRGDKFIIQADLIFVIHGTFTPLGEPVSIICLNFNFVSVKSRRFRRAKIKLQFYGKDDKPGPEVDHVHPSFFLDKKSSVRRRVCIRWWLAFGTIDGYDTPIFSIAPPRKEIFRWTKKYAAKTIGEKKQSKNNTSGRDDIATWTLTESSDNHGVTHDTRTFILLKRKDDEPFYANLNLEPFVDYRYRLKENLDTLRGKTRESGPLCFDPQMEPKIIGTTFGKPKGVDLGNLCRFWDKMVAVGCSMPRF